MTYALPTTGLATDDAPTGPASTVREVWDASLKAQRDVSNPLSREYVLGEEYDKRIREVEGATGIRLHHPLRDAPSDADYLEARDDPEAGWQGSLGQGAVRKKSELRFHRELARLAEQHPDKAEALRPGATVWDEAYARVRKAEQASGDITARSPLAVNVPLLGLVDPVGLAGSMAGFFYDPVNIATMFIGPGGSAAKGILWNASRQAVAGAAQQAAIEPFTQAWRAEAGLDFGFRQAAGNILMAGVAGGALDAAGRSAWRGLAGLPQSGTPEAPRVVPGAPANENGPASIGASESVSEAPVSGRLEGENGSIPRRSESLSDPIDALDAAARRLPEDHPARRAADGDPDATIALAERAMALSDDPEAMRGALSQFRMETLQERAVVEALEAADADLAVARRIRMDLGDEIARAVQHVVDPDSMPPTRPVIVDDVAEFWDPNTGEALARSDVDQIVEMWRYVREMRRKPKPQSLVDYLISVGGISDETTDARHLIGGAKQRPGLVSKRGMNLDDAALSAWQRGYLGFGDRPDVNALLDAIDNDVRGNRVYSDVDGTAADDLRIANEMEVDLDQLGVASARTEADVRRAFARESAGGAESGEAAARSALREGDLDPVQAAALIRERPELAGEVAPTTETARGIHALAGLSDAGFARVTAGEVEPQLAALVASSAPPGAHADLIDRLVAARPRDLDHARRLVAEMLQAPTDAGTARMILGLDEPELRDMAAPVAGGQPKARLKSPEFDEPVGEAAKAQADALAPVAERQARIDDLSMSLRAADAAGRDLDMSPEVRPFELVRKELVDYPGGWSEQIDATMQGGRVSAYRHREKKITRLENAWIDDEHRGKGIGLAMYRALIDEALARGDVVWSSTNNTDMAENIYSALKRRGYNVVKPERDPYARGQPKFIIDRMTDDFDPSKASSANLMERLRDGSSLAGTAYAPKFLDAKAQADALAPVAERQAQIDDLSLSLRSLDMSPEARKKRAEKMGFDTGTVWYHGTKAMFDAFDGRNADASSKTGVPDGSLVFTDSSKNAATYASDKVGFFGDKFEYRDGAKIIPVYHKYIHDLRVDARGNNWSDIEYRGKFYNINELAELAKELEYEGLTVLNVVDSKNMVAASDPATTRFVFDPANIRSVNADFDPAQASSANLMARLRDGSSLAGTAYAPKFLDAEAQLAADLADAATRTLPRNVALQVADRLRVGDYELDGYFDRRNNLIAVALDSGDPRATFTHERIHALKAHGLFAPEEWGLLVAEARKAGVRQEMGRDLVEAYRDQLTPQMVKERLAARGVTLASEFKWPDLMAEMQKAKLLDPKDVRGSLERAGLWDEARLQAMIDEETVARLAETWRAGGDVPASVKGLLERVMAFLERVRNVLAGHGFQTLDDVFRRIDDGEVAMRQVQDAMRAEDITAMASSGDKLFMFAGRKARTADLDKLARAEEMDANGAARDAIWRDTGWFKGVDGQWRFEIDDSKASLSDALSLDRDVPLPEHLKHGRLWRAYPDGRRIGVGLEGDQSNFGSFDAIAGRVGLAADIDPVFEMGTLLHEAQHFVQTEEGFASGGLVEGASKRARDAYRRLAGEVEARTVEKRMDMTPAQRRARPPWLDYDVPEAQQIVRFADTPEAAARMALDDAAAEADAGALVQACKLL